MGAEDDTVNTERTGSGTGGGREPGTPGVTSREPCWLGAQCSYPRRRALLATCQHRQALRSSPSVPLNSDRATHPDDSSRSRQGPPTARALYSLESRRIRSIRTRTCSSHAPQCFPFETKYASEGPPR